MTERDMQVRPQDGRIRIRELPESERPRERLLKHGPAALSGAELLAILIGTGNAAKSESALDLAQRILAWCRKRQVGEGEAAEGTVLRYLVVARPEELCEIPGIGPAKAVRLSAAMELSRRLAAVSPKQVVIRRPADVAALFHEEMRYFRREHLRIVMLDTRRRVQAVDTISIGGLDATIVHPREVFRAAIQRSASAIVLVHNHPSGDPTPSPDDLEVTRRTLEAGRIVGIELLDHLVIGDRQYVSIRELHSEWFS